MKGASLATRLPYRGGRRAMVPVVLGVLLVTQATLGISAAEEASLPGGTRIEVTAETSRLPLDIFPISPGRVLKLGAHDARPRMASGHRPGHERINPSEQDLKGEKLVGRNIRPRAGAVAGKVQMLLARERDRWQVQGNRDTRLGLQCGMGSAMYSCTASALPTSTQSTREWHADAFPNGTRSYRTSQTRRLRA